MSKKKTLDASVDSSNLVGMLTPDEVRRLANRFWDKDFWPHNPQRKKALAHALGLDLLED